MIVFGFVIPFLVGIMMDLYVLMPLRLSDMNENVFDIYLTIVIIVYVYMSTPYLITLLFSL
jgi:hypothetical protein